MTEREALMILNAVSTIGNRVLMKLISFYGSARHILSLKKSDFLSDNTCPDETADKILSFPKEEFLEKEIQLIKGHDVNVMTLFDEDYPSELKNIPDAPAVLYVKGNRQCMQEMSFAIVGSRRASFYGLSIAQRFARQMSEMGFTIVSGMARGIDTAAHRGALQSSKETVAVLGCGLSNVYPPENKDLLEQIVRKGVVLSEFPMSTPPLPYNFPRRNRIISGLSLGVLIVEAAKKSGALITADFALEQGRNVYAVPGDINNPYASGTHELIKQGAKCATSLEDILEDLAPRLQSAVKKDLSEEESSCRQSTLTEQEKTVLNNIGENPIHVDEIIQRSSSSLSSTASVLMDLELKKYIKQMPGKLIKRI